MYCKICGATLTPGDVFCKNCGASNSNITEPKAPEVEPISNVEPPKEPELVEMIDSTPTADFNDNNQVNQFEQPADVIEQPKVEVNTEEKVSEAEKEDKSGNFLVIIGAVVGLLAALVIGYLIYSSLSQKSEPKDNPNVTFVTQNNYSVVYASYIFNFNSDELVTIDESLNVKNADWTAKINYVTSPEFLQLTVENIQKVFENVADYKVEDLALKNYSGLSCYEANVNYNNNAKTALLLCNRELGGYWNIEVGKKDYASYPTSDVSGAVVKLISEAKATTVEDDNLKVGRVQVEIETDLENTEIQNQ